MDMEWFGRLTKVLLVLRKIAWPDHWAITVYVTTQESAQATLEKDYSSEVKIFWNLCPYILLTCLLFSSWCALQTVRHFLKLLPVSIVSEALFIYDMTSCLADSRMLKAKIHVFWKQCLRNFYFINETWKKQSSKVGQNRPESVFYIIANRPKTSPNHIFCSIEMSPCATFI